MTIGAKTMTTQTLGPKHAGMRLRDYETNVAWRDVMNYSAAIGDANPRYFDDERPGGIIALPLSRRTMKVES